MLTARLAARSRGKFVKAGSWARVVVRGNVR